MNKLLAGIAMIACSGLSTAQAADKHSDIDLATYTCEEFLQAMENGQTQQTQALAMWLDGYLGGISGNTEINWHDLKQYSDDLIAYCRKSTSSGMLEAGRKAGL